MISKLKILLVLVFGVVQVCCATPAYAQELKMNTIEFCPETPYELWYPTSKTGMFLDGKMNITKDTLTFDTHGEFKYEIHTSPEGFTYLELDRVSNLNGGMAKFVYLRYEKVPHTYENQSCLLQVHDCTTREGIEYIIRKRNTLPNFGGDKAYCGRGPYFRDVDRGRMIGLVTPDIHKK